MTLSYSAYQQRDLRGNMTSQIVLLNGFQKKSQKTPALEKKKAIKIIKSYEEEQKHKNA